MASNQSSIASAAVPCYTDVHVHLEEDDTHILAAADPSADNTPININECMCWPFYRALIAELVATFLLVYITVATIIGDALLKHTSPCGGVGTLGIAWSFGGIVFVLVYCTTATSGECHYPSSQQLFFLIEMLHNSLNYSLYRGRIEEIREQRVKCIEQIKEPRVESEIRNYGRLIVLHRMNELAYCT